MDLSHKTARPFKKSLSKVQISVSLNTVHGDLGQISDSSKKKKKEGRKRKDTFELLAAPASWAGDTGLVYRNLSSRTQVDDHLNVFCVLILEYISVDSGTGCWGNLWHMALEAETTSWN